MCTKRGQCVFEEKKNSLLFSLMAKFRIKQHYTEKYIEIERLRAYYKSTHLNGRQFNLELFLPTINTSQFIGLFVASVLSFSLRITRVPATVVVVIVTFMKFPLGFNSNSNRYSASISIRTVEKLVQIKNHCISNGLPLVLYLNIKYIECGKNVLLLCCLLCEIIVVIFWLRLSILRRFFRCYFNGWGT